MKKALIGTAAAVVVIAGVVIVLDQLSILSDEPPIRVRNGSIEIHAGVSNGTPWAWKEEGNGYDHEPGDWLSFTWKFWVTVDAGTGSNPCNRDPKIGEGDRVDVTFLSDDSERTITFNRIGPFWNVRTKVQPKTLLTLASPTTLKSIGAGYVKKVEIGNLSCTFGTKDSLEAINICVSSSDQSCR